MAQKEDIRLLALESLLAIEKTGRKGNGITDAVLERYSYLEKTDRAFYTRLVRGTLENAIRSDRILDSYSKVPVKKMKPAIRWILRMAVYQIEKMDSVPESAAVNEAVRLAGKKGFTSLKGFVNGILRAWIRHPERFAEPGRDEPAAYLETVCSVPGFLAERLVKRYGPETAEKICRSFEGAGNLTVRIRKDEEKTLRSLTECGVRFEKAPYVPGAYRLFGVDRIADLEAFRNGSIFVQDISSMLAVLAAGIRPGSRILDICAAPGGKSIFAADLAGKDGLVTARDISGSRLQRLEENRERCGLSNLRTEVRDAADFDPALEGSMDVVLADVPCSGYGVIGKKSDIVLFASAEKEAALIELQQKILCTAARYVKKGGVLIYSTCTINEAENEEQIRKFLEQGGFESESLSGFLPGELAEDTAEKGMIQLLPGVHDCDGFFIARLRRSFE